MQQMLEQQTRTMTQQPEQYLGMRIKWDEDNDVRIYAAIDWVYSKLKEKGYETPQLDLLFQRELETIGERKANLEFVWKRKTVFAEDVRLFLGEACDAENIHDYWVISHTHLADALRKDLLYFDVPRLVTLKQRHTVLKRQDWLCNYCHAGLKWSLRSPFDKAVAHIDHVHPYSKRSSYERGFLYINEDSNLQALCPDCNLKKQAVKK